jgi:hypothetical protein
MQASTATAPSPEKLLRAALAAYVPAADGTDRAYGVMVLVVAEDRILAITGFQEASLFQAFGLPQALV